MNYNSKNWKVFVLFLEQIAIQKKLSKNEIARRTGFDEANIRRIFNLKFCPTMRVFLALSQAVGINFFFEDKEGTSELNVAFEKAMQELGRRENPLRSN
jgi:hypothetical protein